MENYFQLNMDKRQIDAISNLGLAHIGDGVYELMCRSYLCAKGDLTHKKMHLDAIALAKATTQARFADILQPHLTPEELDYYRRGKNAHSHGAPKSATAKEYSKATGLEALFGALHLAGRDDRANELFCAVMEETYGL